MSNPNRDLVTCKVVHGLCAVLIFPIFLGIGHAQAVAPVNSDAEQVILRFLTAFNNLDWPVFRDCFSNSPTMFFPFPLAGPPGGPTPSVRRIEGEEFDKVWQDSFDRARKQAAAQGKARPPFLDIKPEDLRIDRLTDEVALVTFRLGKEPRLSRRTIVLQRFSNGWKIVHIHASNVDTAPAN
jgi:hypothetical protein